VLIKRCTGKNVLIMRLIILFCIAIFYFYFFFGWDGSQYGRTHVGEVGV
jgi:hypothetical protein